MFTLLGISIPFLSRADILEKIKEAKKPLFIVTLNPEILLLARKDKTYRDIIENADIKVVDGVGITLIARFLYGIKLTRIPGADLADGLIKWAGKEGEKIFILGGTATANRNAIATLVTNYQLPVTHIKGFGSKFTFHEAIKKINDFKPNILFVALGAPKQEQFIYNFLLTTHYSLQTIAIGIGGTIDYWANPKLRAPKIVRHIGFEWLWRLVLQPWRFSRIFKAVIVFPLTCLWEWFLVKWKREKHW